MYKYNLEIYSHRNNENIKEFTERVNVEISQIITNESKREIEVINHNFGEINGTWFVSVLYKKIA